MRISSSAGSTRLYVEQLSYRVRSTTTKAATETGARQDPTTERIRTLVNSLHTKFLSEARRGGGSTSLQSFTDAALAEISALLGEPLLLGGPENAVIQGLEQQGLVGLEILSLPANATAIFDDISIQQFRPATIHLTDVENLIADGANFSFSQSSLGSGTSIDASSSVRDLVNSINSSGLGLRAERTQRGLLIRDLSNRAGFQLTYNGDYQSAASPVFTISGRNEAQLAAASHSGLAAEQVYAIQGSRASLNSAASIEYQDDGNGLVTGSIAFDLTGSLGTRRIDIQRGESLSLFAGRVNLVSGSTGVVADVQNDHLALRSTTDGSQSGIRVSNVQPQYEHAVDGVNASQVSGFELQDIPDGTALQLQGSIDQTAEAAELVYQGSGTATVVDTATFTLQGTLGSAEVQIVKDETLDQVRQRINDLTNSTGIEAQVQANSLVFRSVNSSSTETLRITLLEVSESVQISGDNAAQVTNFQLLSHTRNSTNTLNSTVTQAATRGSLTYTGFLNTASSNATFTLTGGNGSASISVTALQSLTSVRDAVNARTADTGVTAVATGNTLTFQSAGFGSDGIVQIATQSGTFNTSGGDGQGNAIGQDALLVINGQSITANGKLVSYADALGSYSMTLQAPNVTGALDPITITATDGAFDIVGGDGNGYDVGQDAVATLNGTTLTATGNHFSTTLDDVTIEFTAVSGYVGALDPISISSTAHTFSIAGANEQGFASGADGTAIVNGQTFVSATNRFVVPVGDGHVTLDFASGFTGDFDPLTISSELPEQPVRRSFNKTYSAHRSLGGVVFRGSEIPQNNGVYVLEQNGVSIALKTAPAFSGKLQPITIRAGGMVDVKSKLSPLTGERQLLIKEALADLFSVASGNSNAGFEENFAAALSISSLATSRFQMAIGEKDPNIIPRRSLLDVLV